MSCTSLEGRRSSIVNSSYKIQVTKPILYFLLKENELLSFGILTYSLINHQVDKEIIII
jgi:hypothetical protein